MFARHSACILLLVLSTTAAGMGGETGSSANGATGMTATETAAVETLLPALLQWEPGKIRDLGRRLSELPDPVAAEALWRVTTAPARMDTSQFFAMALSSPSPVIRRQATDILASTGSADGMRLLKSLLIGERDPETIADIVGAIARQPERRATPALIAIILDAKAPPQIAAKAAEQLRRLTRTDISDSPTAWRDWWLDHSHAYEQRPKED